MKGMTNSHILVHEFDYVEPTSLADAVAMLSQYGERARVLSGGTDLLVQMKMERLAPSCLVSIGKVPGLDYIAARNGTLHIGSRTSIRTIRQSSQVQAVYPALAEACASFSSTQVQTMGTIGGNLCNGSPASDTAPALLAFGAEAVIQGRDGIRRLPLDEFFLSPGKTAIEPGELLVSVVLPKPRPGTGSAFLKVSRVSADLAKVNAAVVLSREGSRITDCRLAFGSVAPRPMRTPKAEAMLAGQVVNEVLLFQAAQAAAEEVTPIDDPRSTAWYRREIVRVLAHDGLTRAWERAAEYDGSGFSAQEARLEPQAAGAPSAVTTTYLPAQAYHDIRLTVNGRQYPLRVKSNDLLLNVLQEQLHLTGTKYGCGIGECAACTVQMDGRPVLSCLVLAIAAEGHEILTVEGLQQPDGTLDPLQQAFIDNAAFQCGYCTPGMLMTAKSLLNENPCPTEDAVRDHMRGNLCRCTGYASIVRAVMSCADQRRRS
jgi:xanthine dehydrogenase iron-sulfur cluster and FAD-binding subunit A